MRSALESSTAAHWPPTTIHWLSPNSSDHLFFLAVLREAILFADWNPLNGSNAATIVFSNDWNPFGMCHSIFHGSSGSLGRFDYRILATIHSLGGLFDFRIIPSSPTAFSASRGVAFNVIDDVTMMMSAFQLVTTHGNKTIIRAKPFRLMGRCHVA